MDQSLRQILKQSIKIARILTRISEHYPQTSQDIDLALYANIKVQKIVNKHLQAHVEVDRQGPEEESEQRQGQDRRGTHYADPMFDAAVRSIEGFRQVTAKLDSKINILINQTHKKGRPLRTYGHQTSQPSQPRHQLKGVKLMKGRGRQPPQQQQQNQSQKSRSMRQIDYSILQLTRQILSQNQQPLLADTPASSVDQYDEGKGRRRKHSRSYE